MRGPPTSSSSATVVEGTTVTRRFGVHDFGYADAAHDTKIRAIFSDYYHECARVLKTRLIHAADKPARRLEFAMRGRNDAARNNDTTETLPAPRAHEIFKLK